MKDPNKQPTSMRRIFEFEDDDKPARIVTGFLADEDADRIANDVIAAINVEIEDERNEGHIGTNRQFRGRPARGLGFISLELMPEDYM